MIREKAQVNSMNVALSSLFEKKVLERYNAEIDKLLKSTNFLSEETPDSNGRRSKTRRSVKRTSEQKSRDAQRSVGLLTELDVLFRG